MNSPLPPLLPLALSLGDPAGVGPELIAAAWAVRVGAIRLFANSSDKSIADGKYYCTNKFAAKISSCLPPIFPSRVILHYPAIL